VAKGAAVRRRPARVNIFEQRKANPIVALLQILTIIAVAYFAAVFFNTFLLRVSQMPHGPLWDPQFQMPLYFLMMVAVCVLIGIPFFMKEWDPTLRRFSMYTVLFIIAYAVFDGSGVVDPALPMKWLTAHAVVPLHNWFLQMGSVRK
jgi:hypothetical protein